MNKLLTLVLLLVLYSDIVVASSTKPGRARTEVEGLLSATNLLISDTGEVPAENEWPEILLGKYLSKTPVDPWGQNYRMEFKNNQIVGVYSIGRNGTYELGGGDDITSWGGFDRKVYFPNRHDNIFWPIAIGVLLFLCVCIGLFVLIRVFLKSRAAK